MKKIILQQLLLTYTTLYEPDYCSTARPIRLLEHNTSLFMRSSPRSFYFFLYQGYLYLSF